MSAPEVTKQISEVSPLFKAGAARFFWLIVFLAGSLALFLGGGVLLHSANIVASLCYIVVTLLLYNLLKPVNRSVSLVAAFFGLVGCAVSLFGLTRFVLLRDLVFFGLQCLLIGYLILCASNSGCFDGASRIGLADLSVAAARKLSVPLQSDPRHARGRFTDPVAPRDRRKHSTMEGAGQRCRGNGDRRAPRTFDSFDCYGGKEHEHS